MTKNNIKDGDVDTTGYVTVYPKYVRKKSIYKMWSITLSKQNQNQLKICIIAIMFCILLLITLLFI
jgi:hypothetical protein